ncbi:hypothetical protein FOVG_19337 [Fusarium oxysporum f. sp. pisi HDV247]|uniref:Heterokaryon incompatibility domain-containing protein n=1 Tax=Fusarium oxysporum f. sp. pisi HDV247 TaxID=1080344 RepID=W9N921_FUSOX|nr:hypothetical protein FOVG_19337 [Fusarium oxysporum f. sp. pisi HDV247]
MIADLGVSSGTTWERRGDGEFAEVLSRELLEDAPEDTLVSHSTAGRPYSLLLRKWLWDCDQNHIQCERPQRKQIFWPKRVIFVGDSNKLVLVEDQLHGEDYLVLSHCWGRPTVEEKKLFCTTRENYKGRLHKSFSYDELPRTFQDAVRVTRLLGKQYLWIDEICIIQGPDGDWETEARTMEDIFASAYCTIAASSAGGWGDGFLQPDLDSHHIGMQGIPSTPICACDFERDVDEGPLVKRAWVLQERVLSRRIIHFAATHTYWECGKGVRCEQFTKLEPPPGKQYFILDPGFPRRLSLSGFARTVDFVQFLFKKYSTSGLTFPSDRDVAIYSLVERMRHALRTEVRYGVVRCFLGSILLWKRSDEEKTARIDYGGRTVPSWSWMVYPGGIDFIVDAKQRLRVPRSADLDFTDDGYTLTVKVRRFNDCRIGQDGKQFAIFDMSAFASPGKVGSLWFDMAETTEFKHCVIVGMDKDHQKEDPWKTYYFLLVREKQGGEGYERLGVGKVEARYVSKECDAGKLW